MISASESFHFATLELVRSTPIKQRLICAYRRHLSSVAEEEIPPEIRPSFGQILRSLCGVKPLRGEDAVAASVRKMSNQEADECAALIVENVDPDGTASIIYTFGPMGSGVRAPGGVLHGTGIIRDGELRFQNSDGTQFALRPGIVDLLGRMTTPGGQSYEAVFKKTL